MKTALIAFHEDNISIRSLSAFLKARGKECLCFFCQEPLTEGAIKALAVIMKEQCVALAGVSLVTDDFAKAVRVTEFIRKELRVPVVWGGSHADVMAEESLAHADMVCKGEGEEALVELAQAVEQGNGYGSIANIWSRQGGSITRNPMRELCADLDGYPFPEFDAGTHYYLRKGVFEQGRRGREVYNIMGSRGCPYCCRYCYNNYRRGSYEGKGVYVRSRGIKSVLTELALARRSYGGLREVNFWDDSFFIRGREELLEFSARYRAEVALPFNVLGEPMAFDGEKLRILADCGLKSVQMGVQTGSDRVNREVYGRHILAKEMIAVARAVHEAGVKAKYDIIFNNPYETQDDIRQTLMMLLDFPLPLTLDGFNLIFYPGTEITRRALADGLIAPRDKEAADLSSIQSEANSPLTARGDSVTSSRFYAVRFSSRGKEYLNSLFRLLGSRYIPRRLFIYLIKTGSPLIKALVRMCAPAYLYLVSLRNAGRRAG